jgi:WD40 repeat protein
MAITPGAVRKWILRLGVVLLLPLAVVGADRLIPPWPRLTFTLSQPDQGVDGISADGSLLATNDGPGGWETAPGALRVYDLKTGRPCAALQNADDVWPGLPAFSPDGRFVCADAASAIKVWDVASGSLVGQLKNPDDDGSHRCCAEFTPDSRSVVLLVTWSGPLKKGEGKELWDVGLKQVQGVLPKQAEGPDREERARRFGTRDVTLSRDGRWAAEVRDGGIDLLDAATGEFCGRLGRPGDTTDDRIWPQFTKDGRFLVVERLVSRTAAAIPFDKRPSLKNPLGLSYSEHVARLWDVETRREVFTFPDCNQVHLSRDGKTIVTRGPRDYRHIKVWDMPPAKPWWAAPAAGGSLWAMLLAVGLAVRRLRRRAGADGGSRPREATP